MIHFAMHPRTQHCIVHVYIKVRFGEMGTTLKASSIYNSDDGIMFFSISYAFVTHWILPWILICGLECFLIP